MLSEVFYWALNISIAGGLAGLVVFAAGRLRRLPRFAAYLLWAAPLLRLWTPFGIASRFSLMSLLSGAAARTVPVGEGFVDIEITASNFLRGAESYFPIAYKTDLLERIFGVASIVWLIIAAATVLAALYLYFLTKAELKGAVLTEGNVYRSEKISAPAVYGIFRPKIIIPAASPVKDLTYILMHERVHIRRGDNFWRGLAVITACVHWFNPLVWIFLKQFFADMELSCDEKVLKNLSREESREYAKAILSCAAGKTLFASAFGGAKTKVRVESILSYKKLTLLSSLFLALFTIAVALVLITGAAA